MCHSRTALLALALVGCVKFETSKGPGDYALQFYGDPSCVAIETPGAALSTLTLEGWIQADKARELGPWPFLMWPGAMELFIDEDGRARFTDGTEARNGASFPASWMDGELHHIAGTWDGETVRLFVDGTLQGFGAATLLSNASEQMYFGCHPFNQWYHKGILDEVRISRGLRYTEDFTPVHADFVEDEETISLWHFSEGSEAKTADAIGKAKGDLEAVDWVEFSLGDSGADTGG